VISVELLQLMVVSLVTTIQYLTLAQMRFSCLESRRPPVVYTRDGSAATVLEQSG